ARRKVLMMEWKNRSINVAVQVLPQADGGISYELVDNVIEAIRETGFNYEVCPFETVVECRFEQLSRLLDIIHEAAWAAGTTRMLTNLKIQVDFEKNVTI